MDINGAEGSDIVGEVPSFQRLQERYLGWEKVSCLERCPHVEMHARVVLGLGKSPVWRGVLSSGVLSFLLYSNHSVVSVSDAKVKVGI